jgi:NDP-sugar pyrophosphorylase family protein
MLPIIILAGGLATRMRPVTEKIPKAMLEVAGRPFIAHQLHLLRKRGIGQVILCVGYLGEIIEEYAGKGDSFQLDIQYSYDGVNLLGTGGAIKNIGDRLPDDFFVLYGDSYLDIE